MELYQVEELKDKVSKMNKLSMEDKLLDVIYSTQIGDMHGDDFLEYFAPLREKLEKTVSAEIYKELDEMLTDCAVACDRHYGVEGMKVALHIALGDCVILA